MNIVDEFGAWAIVLDNLLERHGWKEEFQKTKETSEVSAYKEFNLHMNRKVNTVAASNVVLGQALKVGVSASASRKEKRRVSEHIDSIVKEKNSFTATAIQFKEFQPGSVSSHSNTSHKEIMNCSATVAVNEAIGGVKSIDGPEEILRVLRTIQALLNLDVPTKDMDDTILTVVSEKLHDE